MDFIGIRQVANLLDVQDKTPRVGLKTRLNGEIDQKSIRFEQSRKF
jgi:hypothetical protein